MKKPNLSTRLTLVCGNIFNTIQVVILNHLLCRVDNAGHSHRKCCMDSFYDLWMQLRQLAYNGTPILCAWSLFNDRWRLQLFHCINKRILLFLLSSLANGQVDLAVLHGCRFLHLECKRLFLVNKMNLCSTQRGSYSDELIGSFIAIDVSECVQEPI